MKERVFIPKYHKGYIFVFGVPFLVGILGMFLIVWRAIQEQSIVFFIQEIDIFAIFLSLTCVVLLIPFFFFKKILFGDSFRVERYVYKDKVINYNEVVDFGSDLVITKQGKISTYAMQNSLEFYNILNPNLGARGIRIKGEIFEKEECGRKAFWISIPIYAVVILPIMSEFDYKTFSEGKDFAGLIFAGVYLLIYIIIRLKTKYTKVY